IHVLLQDEVHFPVPPLDGRQPVRHVGWKAFPIGVLLFAEEEVTLVHAIDWAILRDLRSADVCERREEVHDVNDLVADAPCRHLPWPTDDKRHAYRTFHRGEIRTPPWPAVTLPGMGCLGTIVAGEND